MTDKIAKPNRKNRGMEKGFVAKNVCLMKIFKIQTAPKELQINLMSNFLQTESSCGALPHRGKLFVVETKIITIKKAP